MIRAAQAYGLRMLAPRKGLAAARQRMSTLADAKLPVSELFASVQGEGPFCGRAYRRSGLCGRSAFELSIGSACGCCLQRGPGGGDSPTRGINRSVGLTRNVFQAAASAEAAAHRVLQRFHDPVKVEG